MVTLQEYYDDIYLRFGLDFVVDVYKTLCEMQVKQPSTFKVYCFNSNIDYESTLMTPTEYFTRRYELDDYDEVEEEEDTVAKWFTLNRSAFNLWANSTGIKTDTRATYQWFGDYLIRRQDDVYFNE